MPRILWPKTKFADTNTIAAQIAHIFSEIDEAAEAFDSNDLASDGLLLGGHYPSATALHFFRELADAQGSTETLWHVLDRVFGAGFSEKMILSWVEEKNRARGYYVEDRRTGLERMTDELQGVEYRAVLPGGLGANAEDLLKAIDYYRSGAMQNRPNAPKPSFVPSRVRLSRRISGDAPFGSDTQAGPGEFDCKSGQWGAVSITADNGKQLGLRLDEFEPIAWVENK